MSDALLLFISVDYNADSLRGILSIKHSSDSAIWDRMRQAAGKYDDFLFTSKSISLPWPAVLSLVREFAPQQRKWGFRFQPTEVAKQPIANFLTQFKAVRAARLQPLPKFNDEEIDQRLKDTGFTKRNLRPFQLRDLKKLAALHNGANFSVPGAGKTTVTFALHLLIHKPGQHLMVVGPKAAFSAWSEIVDDCINDSAPGWAREPFTVLTGGRDNVAKALRSGSTRFIINYEQLISLSTIFSVYLTRQPVHLVLDESHRMKGGLAVQRGAILLNAASLPFRRDILSGTPMPQSPSDLQSQLDFLWPGSGIGVQIGAGQAPREVIGNLYVRTTKTDLNLPPVNRHFKKVEMSKGQSALYAVVRNETLRDLSTLRAGSEIDLVRARRSVMRLLQLSTNPVLALRGIIEGSLDIDSGIVQQVLDDGPSPKMIAVRDLARELAAQNRKTVIWSIFTDTIQQMELMLADLSPVTVYGDVPSGDYDDMATREGRIRQFNNNADCMAFIANPAAAGESISLHNVCHDAIYVDRSYNTTHYLQSIDRIHRLGLPPETETNVYIFQTMAPKGLGCVDHSVSRRLAVKLRALQQLLDDEDIHKIAFDEEESDTPIDYDIEPKDLIDLIYELEERITFNEDEEI